MFELGRPSALCMHIGLHTPSEMSRGGSPGKDNGERAQISSLGEYSGATTMKGCNMHMAADPRAKVTSASDGRYEPADIPHMKAADHRDVHRVIVDAQIYH